MISLSRRQVLAGGVALTTGLSGCSGSGSAGTDTATVTERSFERSVSDPSTRTLRNSDGDPAVTSTARSTGEELQGTPSRSGHEYWRVSKPGEREALRFGGATSGGDEGRTFAAETDLSTSTLFVHQYYVRECKTRELELIEWGAADQGPEGWVEIELTYDDVSLAGDCEEGDPGPVEATLFRIPDEVGTVKGFGYMA